jgi:hypothetical protein
MPQPDVDARVASVVDSWLVWLPRWTPSLARRGTRVCRKCFGSPVVQAAGLEEAPHKVQHALVSRIHALVDADVEAYTASELPLLQDWLTRSEAERRAERAYRPEEGLDHEFEGLGVDPDPVEGAPYLFTLAGLSEESTIETAPTEIVPEHPHPEDEEEHARHHRREALTAMEKDQVKQQIQVADQRAMAVGRAACMALAAHRQRIADAVAHVVTPQVEALMDELSAGLDIPDSPDSLR